MQASTTHQRYHLAAHCTMRSATSGSITRLTVMFEPLALRDEHTSPGLVVVRLGARTLDDDLLRRSVDECRKPWGIWGFSVLEVPGGDYEQLVRMRPIVADQRRFLTASNARLASLDLGACGRHI